jgi:sialic acid synthase SpsE
LQVIAEVGSNIKDHDDCIRSVLAAKASGADVVKFQYYTGQDLFGPLYGGNNGLIVNVEQISEECAWQGIEFMCTAFSPAGYRMIDPYVKRHKVASSEITALDILSTVNSFGKPVILSTGGATHDEIAEALLVLRNVPVTILYCEVAYPARIVDFRHFDNLKDRFGEVCEIGYSDHTIDVLTIPGVAKARGATVIEKHVNFAGHTDTPDAGHSISGPELSMMVRYLKNELPISETFNSNPWKRKLIALPDGARGYFRPLPNDL